MNATRVGPKGQILIRKYIRDRLGIKPGNYIETILNANGLLIKPINPKKELEKMSKLRDSLSKQWSSHIDCVEAARDTRR